MSDRLPDWWYALSPLTTKPDAQYQAGAADMLALLRARPELLAGEDAKPTRPPLPKPDPAWFHPSSYGCQGEGGEG